MTKFPLLEQMRADRQRRENEVTAPVRAALDICAERAASLQASLRALEKVVGSEIGRYVVEEVSHSLSGELRRHIYEAVAAGKPSAPTVTMTLPTEVLHFMDPKSIESEVLGRYVVESLPRVRLRAERRISDMVTVMDIRIPELGFRRAIAGDR